MRVRELSGCAHLHVHSEYAAGRHLRKIDALAARAAAFGQPAIGLTDHGVIDGAVELVKAAKKRGVKPVVGLEAYYVDDRTVHEGEVLTACTLLAADDRATANLVRAVGGRVPGGPARGKP